MQIVTGKTGTPHITSVQQRAMYQGVIGKDAYILNTGSNLEAEIYSANEIHIKDGMLVTQGCSACVDVGTYDTVKIANGSQGMKRKDLIVARYQYDNSQGKESMVWVVLQGTPNANNPTVPLITNTGDIQQLDNIVDTAVFVVNLDGVSVTSVEKLVNVSPALNNANKILWSGSNNMGSGVSIELPEPISEQVHGIDLVFALNSGNTTAYGDMGTLSIKKESVGLLNGNFVFDLGTVAFGTTARKRLKVEDNKISGDSYNTQSGTVGGITFDNSKLSLVQIIGW